MQSNIDNSEILTAFNKRITCSHEARQDNVEGTSTKMFFSTCNQLNNYFKVQCLVIYGKVGTELQNALFIYL